MVQDTEAAPVTPSAWIHVPGGPSARWSSGNWSDAEGRHLDELLGRLRDAGCDMTQVMLLGPFRDVATRLPEIGKRYGIPAEKAGTVHTAQGKEADIVVFVLGGGTDGARRWAAGRPNLLNVAVSRAKRRFFVIGDRQDWAQRPNFSVLDRHLE